MAITSASDPAHGTVALTGGTAGAHTGLTYAPDANYCNSQAGGTRTRSPTASTGGSTATVSVTVTCVDDNPTAVNDSATVTEDSAPTALAVLTNDTDIDGGPKTDRVGHPARQRHRRADRRHRRRAHRADLRSPTPTTATARPAARPTRSPTR